MTVHKAYPEPPTDPLLSPSHPFLSPGSVRALSGLWCPGTDTPVSYPGRERVSQQILHDEETPSFSITEQLPLKGPGQRTPVTGLTCDIQSL